MSKAGVPEHFWIVEYLLREYYLAIHQTLQEFLTE
jgi:hypothetical protein